MGRTCPLRKSMWLLNFFVSFFPPSWWLNGLVIVSFMTNTLKDKITNYCIIFWGWNPQHHSRSVVLCWNCDVCVVVLSVCNCRINHWGRAAPWLSGSNPRDVIMPVDGDDGFFPFTGNELVSLVFSLSIIVIWDFFLPPPPLNSM